MTEKPDKIYAIIEDDISAQILGEVYAQQTPDGMNGQPVEYTRSDILEKIKGLQKEVWDWAKETFGNDSDIGIAIRGNKEMAELLSTMINRPDASEDIIEECADVAFFLLQVCQFHDGDLLKAVADKLEVNKKRSWEKASDGSFQHVEGT